MAGGYCSFDHRCERVHPAQNDFRCACLCCRRQCASGSIDRNRRTICLDFRLWSERASVRTRRRHERQPPLQRSRATWHRLRSRSDIVTLHLPLTAETRGFIGRGQLARMKRSAILINTARGPVVDQLAILEALGQSRLAGAGIDVFDMEPPLPAEHPIFKAPNTVLLPHIGFETMEAMSAKADIALRHLENFLESKKR